MELSVIIPTHNRRILLERAIQSVLSQEHVELECIVINDASTDETKSYLDSIQDARVRCIHNPESLGGAGARNLGLDIAKGEFIAFLDDDDEWQPTKARRQLDVLEADSTLSIVSCRPSYRPYTLVQHLVRPGGHISLKRLCKDNVLGSFSFCMVRASHLGEIRLNKDLRACQDWDVWMKVLRQNDGVAFIIPKRLVVYSREPHARLSTNLSNKWVSTLAFARFHGESMAIREQYRISAEIARMRWQLRGKRRGMIRWFRILIWGTWSARSFNPVFVRKMILGLLK